MKFHGPAEFDAKVWLVNEETEQFIQATLKLGAFEYPSRESIAGAIAGLPDKLAAEGHEGFRLATKLEAIGAWSEHELGERIAVPGGDTWDSIEGD